MYKLQSADCFLSLRSMKQKSEVRPKNEKQLFFSEARNYQDNSKSNYEKSQTEFFNRMRNFLDLKKQKICEQQVQEKLSHHPILTYKGYMSKSKSIDQLAYGSQQKKNEFVKKLKEQNNLKEQKLLKFHPDLNENPEKSSKLGLKLPTQDYIKMLKCKNSEKEEKNANLKMKKIQEDLKECKHKPEIRKFDKKILINRIAEKKQENCNFANSYAKRNQKQPEQKFLKKSIEDKENDNSQINKNINDVKKNEATYEKKISIFEMDIAEIKFELRKLLKD